MDAGLEHHRAGRLDEAEQIYQEVLRQNSNDPYALHLLGVIAHQRGQHETAKSLIGRALKLTPDNPDFLNNLGEARRATGDPEGAISCYDAALTIRPDFVEALSNRGAALERQGRFSEALDSYEKALALRPGFAKAWSNRGNALQGLERYSEALESYERAVALVPGDPELLLNRGVVLQRLSRLEDAVQAYDEALRIQPGFAEALSNRAVALQELGRMEDALASADAAVAAKGDSAMAWYNRGNVLFALHRNAEALESYDRALTLQPNYAEAFSNRGALLVRLERFDDAISSCRKALEVTAKLAEAWYNLGLALQQSKRHEEALDCYSRALVLKPDYVEAHWNEGLCRLSTGDFARGLEKYEWRWRWKDFTSPARGFTQPLWLGREDAREATILLHAEQGFGDAVHFLRYVPEVAKRFTHVVIEVQAELKSLVAHTFPAHTVLARSEPLPAFDYHCPLLSLALALGTRHSSIPASVPYLTVPEDKLGEWRRRLGKVKTLTIGLSWAGRPTPPNRSLPLEKLVPLLESGARFVSLQKDLSEAEAAALVTHSRVLHFGDDIRDFSDTAALVSLVDLVISVDTAAAHIAGALAKPVWILLAYAADWRWFIERADSPWYPTARLFRQPAWGNWDSVVGEVGQELALWGKRKPRAQPARRRSCGQSKKA